LHCPAWEDPREKIGFDFDTAWPRRRIRLWLQQRVPQNQRIAGIWATIQFQHYAQTLCRQALIGRVFSARDKFVTKRAGKIGEITAFSRGGAGLSTALNARLPRDSNAAAVVRQHKLEPCIERACVPG
jgi:hypothetical protein